MESSVRTKLLAGAGMVCISTTVGILYKASQAASGGFKYSTTSAICIAEFVKLAMSASFHLMDKSHGQSINVQKAFSNAMDQLSIYATRHIYILALLFGMLLHDLKSNHSQVELIHSTLIFFRYCTSRSAAHHGCTEQ
eukprot:symbB.v1.2.026256.t1/scaffold2581.1/size75808/5